jgi:multicomponent Na+:H+ antiporter subunit D
VSTLVVLLVAVPLLGAAVVAGLAAVPRGRRLADLLAVAVVATTLGIGVAACFAQDTVVWLAGWEPENGESVGIALVADRPGVLLSTLAAGLTLAGMAYSWHFLENTGAGYQVLMMVFLGAIAGFCLAADLFDAFVWFELMGVAAYALTGLRIEEPRSVHGALTFGVVNTVGASLTLVGVALLYARTGELNLAAVGRELDRQPVDGLVEASLVLLLAGVLVKLAVVPFHFWTADAEAVAPTPVCVLLSGAMITAAAFAVARWWWVVYAGTVDPHVVQRALLVFGVATALVGAVMCAGQRHVKRLLAYSTVSHAGVLLCCVALMTPAGLAAAALYAFGHATTKGALFLGTGVLLNRHGTVDEHDLYGAGRSRVIAYLFLVGGLALAGLPPLGTSIGKLAADEAATTAGYPWLVAVILVTAVCTGGSVLRVTARVWFGLGPRPPDAHDANHDDEEHEEHRESDQPSRRHRLALTVPAWSLLVASAAAVLPPVRDLAGQVGVALTDRSGYAAAVLSGAPLTRPTEPAEVGSPLLGFVAAAAAVGFAAAMIWLPRQPAVTGAMRVLHAVHRAHVGDYVSWLLVGVAVFGALVFSGG